tara:strand:- start:646 stop:1038 length:393 start_codon:yes stop_codon:yes gene_type:complete
MYKFLSIIFVMFFIISCGESETSNKSPSFGYHIDKIVRVNEGSSAIGTFQATDPDGDEIAYSISNIDMSISSEGVVAFNIIPDYETKDIHTAIIVASNDGGSDEINLTVYINDSDCEFDTLAAFDSCTFH